MMTKITTIMKFLMNLCKNIDVLVVVDDKVVVDDNDNEDENDDNS